MLENTSRITRRAMQLKIAAISLAEDMRTGNFKSLYRGNGIEFMDVREYLPGDNVRAIDWNVTARMGRPFIKQYNEDKELAVFFVLDRSLSMLGGSQKNSKIQIASETAALILLASEHNAGANGAVFFDGDIQFACPPKAGLDTAMTILSHLDDYDVIEKKGSALGNALEGAAKMLRRKSLVFILSDFRAVGWEQPLARLAQKNDVIAIKITDPMDSEIPDLGTLPFYDAETGKISVFPTSSKEFKTAWFEHNRNKTDYMKIFCQKHGVIPLTISTVEDPILVLSQFFSKISKN